MQNVVLILTRLPLFLPLLPQAPSHFPQKLMPQLRKPLSHASAAPGPWCDGNRFVFRVSDSEHGVHGLGLRSTGRDKLENGLQDGGRGIVHGLGLWYKYSLTFCTSGNLFWKSKAIGGRVRVS